MRETQQSIFSWGEQTFGPCSALATATRMNVEVAELLADLAAVDDPQLKALIATSIELATAINIRANWLENKGLLIGQPTVGAECPDVLIVLYQVAERCGVDIHKLVDEKMGVNRARTWKRTVNGFQHI